VARRSGFECAGNDAGQMESFPGEIVTRLTAKAECWTTPVGLFMLAFANDHYAFSIANLARRRWD
jgi:hypothetical protein